MNKGRNIKLTTQLENEIISYIKAGNYAKTVCQAVGINESTYYRWIQRAKRGEEPYASFASRIEKARNIAEVALVMKIREAAKESRNWKAAAFLLERTRPLNFSNRRIKH